MTPANAAHIRTLQARIRKLQPTTSRELCATLNRTADQVAGHLTSLIRQGKITRVSRGVYRRGA